MKFVLALLTIVAFAKDEPETKIWRSTRDKSLFVRYPSCWTANPLTYDASENIEFQPGKKCEGFQEGQWRISFGVLPSAGAGGLPYRGALPSGVTLRRIDSPSTSVWFATFACAAGQVSSNASGNLAADAREASNRAVPPKELLAFLKMVGCAKKGDE